ncbi:hypothetical protein Efla_003287 [Eimeria flavescens]
MTVGVQRLQQQQQQHKPPSEEQFVTSLQSSASDLLSNREVSPPCSAYAVPPCTDRCSPRILTWAASCPAVRTFLLQRQQQQKKVRYSRTEAAMVLQRQAANLERALVAAEAVAPQQNSEREHQHLQATPPVCSNRSAESTAGNRLLAAAGIWLPLVDSAESRTDALPPFLTQSAARLQDLLLVHVTCVALREQQTPQQQQHDGMRSFRTRFSRTSSSGSCNDFWLPLCCDSSAACCFN